MKHYEKSAHELTESIQRKIRTRGGDDTTKVMIFTDPNIIELRKRKVNSPDLDAYTYKTMWACTSKEALAATKHFRKRSWFPGLYKRKEAAFCANV